MALSPATESLLWLSALAGAIHVLAPDHWLPASIVAWQRGWGFTRTALFALGALFFHVLLGLVIYFCFDSLLASLQSTVLFLFSVIFVAGVMLLRFARFSRVREVLRAGPDSVWGMFAVLSLLGPCESIIPVLIKARQLGAGYMSAFLAFVIGTTVTGTICVVVGRVLWDRPVWLPWGVTLAHRRITVLPVLAGLAIGLSALLRLS